MVADLKNLVISLDSRVKSLEGGKSTGAPAPSKPVKKEEDDDDGVDLFGSDSEVIAQTLKGCFPLFFFQLSNFIC